MHSFLSKVFGRKKDDKETSPTTLRPGELLDGKFEAISPNVSPSAANFLELDPQAQASSAKDNDKDVGFSLFRAKSRPSPPEIRGRKPDTLPHLSLNFNTTNEDANPTGSDSLFALDLNSQILLSDAIIGRRRLNPLEALVLIRACSQAIVSKGLETLGIMHPHWYSASPDVQRRLISQFIHSMEPKTPPTAFSPNSEVSSPFESEINFTHSPHDVAAVLRWGLRHVQLEGDSFGTDDGWYKAFLDAEAAAEYPPKAFSEKLSPLLPPAHLELLITTLEIFSSLASHSEVNSTSGSKLSKIFGLWLLTARQVEGEDDWQSFYARWEPTGRMLEHLFLSRIRDESTDQRMPVRLLELVRRYPYTHGLSSPTTDLQLLPPPQFTTQSHDAFFVRIEVELPSERRKPKLKVHPLNILADAFSTKVEEGEFAELWAKITAASKNGSNPSPLSNIFADETIRFLSIIPDKNPGKSAEVKSPAFSLLPVSPSSPRGQAFSTGDTDKPTPVQHPKSATEPSPVSAASPLAIGSDWVQFSSSGFLDTTPAIAPLVSTLFDTDVEKTIPAATTLSRKSSKRTKAASRKSVDFSSDPMKPVPEVQTEVVNKEPTSVVKATKLQIIQVDEAFIDFWSDSLLDPITATWPTFIICKFKSTLVPKLVYGPVEDGKQKTLKWLVLEQVITIKPPPAPAPLASPSVSISETTRPVSPALSTSGRNRFSFWNMSRTTSSSSQSSQKGKKKEKATNIGEMGELLEEEANHQVEANLAKKKSTTKSRKSTTGKPKESTQKSADAIVTPTTAPASGTEVQNPVVDKVASPEADDVQERSTPPGSSAPLAVAATAAIAIAGIVTTVGLQNPESEAEKVEPTAKSADTSPHQQDEVTTKDSEPLAAAQSDLKATPGRPSDVPPMANVDPEITTREILVESVAEADSEADIPQTAEVTSAPVEPQAAIIQAAPLQALDDPATEGASLETTHEDIPSKPAVDAVAEADISQLTEVTIVSADPVVTEIQAASLPVLSDSIIEETSPEAATESIPVGSVLEAVPEAEASRPIEVTPVSAVPDVVDSQIPAVQAIGGSEVEKTSLETTTDDLPADYVVEAVTEAGASQPTEGLELDAVNVQTAPLTTLSDRVGQETSAETTVTDISFEPLTEAALEGDISQPTEATPIPEPNVVDIQDASVQVTDDIEVEKASPETTSKDLPVESVVEAVPEAGISQLTEVTLFSTQPYVVDIQNASVQVIDDAEVENASPETITEDIPANSVVETVPELEISQSTKVTSVSDEPDVNQNLVVQAIDDVEVQETRPETMAKDHPVESVVEAVPEVKTCQPTEVTLVSVEPDVVDIQIPALQTIGDSEVEEASPEATKDISIDSVTDVVSEAENAQSIEVSSAPVDSDAGEIQAALVQSIESSAVETSSTTESIPADYVAEAISEAEISQTSDGNVESVEPNVDDSQVAPIIDVSSLENSPTDTSTQDIPASSVGVLVTASEVLLEESLPPAEATVALTVEPLEESSAAISGEQLIDTPSPENITSVTNSTSEPSTFEEADGVHVQPDNVAPTVGRQPVAVGNVFDAEEANLLEEVSSAAEGHIETTAVGECQETPTPKMATVEVANDPPIDSKIKTDFVDEEDALQSEGANPNLPEEPSREEPAEAAGESALGTQGPMHVNDVDVRDDVILASEAVVDVAEVSREPIIVVPEDEPLAISEENEVSQAAKPRPDIEELSSKEPTVFATSLLETSEDEQDTEMTEAIQGVESTATVNEEERLEFALDTEPSGPVELGPDDLQAQAEHVEGSSISSETLQNDSVSEVIPVAYSGTAVEDKNPTDNAEGVTSKTFPEAEETHHSDGQSDIPLIEEQSSGAAAAPEQSLPDPTTLELVNIASGIPTVVSMILPEDSAAEAGIDLAPVPLVANPIEPAQESHITGHEERGPFRESEAFQDVSGLDIVSGSDIPASHRALDLVIAAGSTPGPQTSLGAAMVDLNEAERSPVSGTQHKPEAEKPTRGSEEPEESTDATERISSYLPVEDDEGTPRSSVDEISLDEAPSQKSDVAGLTSGQPPLDSAGEIQLEGVNQPEHVNEAGRPLSVEHQEDSHIALSDSALERQASTVEDDEPSKGHVIDSGDPVNVIAQVSDDVDPAFLEGASVLPLEAPVVSPEHLESDILAEPVSLADVSALSSGVVDSSTVEETTPRQLVKEEPPAGHVAGNFENEHPIDAGTPLETESNQTAVIEVTEPQEDDHEPPTGVEATPEDISNATDAPVYSDIHVIPLQEPQEIAKKGELAVGVDQNMLAGPADVMETSTAETFTTVPGTDVLNTEPVIELEAQVLTPVPALNGLESSEPGTQKEVISDDDPAHGEKIEEEHETAVDPETGTGHLVIDQFLATEESTTGGIVIEANVSKNDGYTAERLVLPSQESNKLEPLEEAPGTSVEQLSATALSQEEEHAEEEHVALAKDVPIEEPLPEQASTVATTDDELRSTAEESEELSKQLVAEAEELAAQESASYDGPPALSREQESPNERPRPVLAADEEKTATDGATEIKQPNVVSEDTADAVPEDHTKEELSATSKEPASAEGKEILAIEEPTGVFDGPATAAEQLLSNETGEIRELDVQIVPEHPKPQINEPETVQEDTLSQPMHVSPESDGEDTTELHNTHFTEESSFDGLKSTAVDEFVDQTDRQLAITDQDDEETSKITEKLVVDESKEQGFSPSTGGVSIDEITSFPMEGAMTVDEQPAVVISDEASSVPLGQGPSDQSLPIEFEGEELTERTKPEPLVFEEASAAAEVADNIEETPASPAMEFIPPTSEPDVEEPVPAEVAESVPVDKPTAILNEAGSPGEPPEHGALDQVLEHKSLQEEPTPTPSSNVVDADHAEEPSIIIQEIHRKGTGAEALGSGEVPTVEEAATAEVEDLDLATSEPHESALNEDIPSGSQVGAAEEVIPDPDAAISIYEPAAIENVHQAVISELSEEPRTIINSDLSPTREGIEEVIAPGEIAEQAVQHPEVPVNGVVSQEERIEASNVDGDKSTGTEHPVPAEDSELPVKDLTLEEAVAEERLVPIVDDVPSENIAPEVPNIAEETITQESPESTGEDAYSHEKAEDTHEAHEDLPETYPLDSTDNLPTKEHTPLAAAVEEAITVNHLEQPNDYNNLSDKSGQFAGQFTTEEQSFAEEPLSTAVEEPAIAQDLAQPSHNDSQPETVKVALEQVLGDSAVEPESGLFVSKEQIHVEELSPVEATITAEDLERPTHDDSLLERSETDPEQPPIEESAVEADPENVTTEPLPAAVVEEPTTAEEFVEPSNSGSLSDQLELEQPTLEMSTIEPEADPLISTEHLFAEKLQPPATEEPVTVDDIEELPREEGVPENSEVALDQPKIEESSTESESHVSTEKLPAEELQSAAVEDPITVKDPEQALHDGSPPEKSEVSLEESMIEESSAEPETESVALAEQSAPEEPLTAPVEEPTTVEDLAQLSRDESSREVPLEQPGVSAGEVDQEPLVSTEQLAAEAYPAGEVEEPMTGGSPKAPSHENSLSESSEASLDPPTVDESAANPTGVVAESAATFLEEGTETEPAEPTEQREPVIVEQPVSTLDKSSAEEPLVDEQPNSPNMAIVDVIPVDSAEITVVEPETTGEKGGESPVAQIHESSPETTGDEPTEIEIESSALQEHVAVLDQDVSAVQPIVEQAGSNQEKPNEADGEIPIEEAEAVDATLSLDDLHEMLPSPSTDFSTVDPDESFATSGPFALESVMSSIGEETDDIDDNDPILDVDFKVSEVEDDILNENGNGHYSTSDAGLSEPVAATVETDKGLPGVTEEAANSHSHNGADPSVVEVLSADSEPPSTALDTGNGHDQETEKSAPFAVLSEEGEPATVETLASQEPMSTSIEV